jgi:hypothetical protein
LVIAISGRDSRAHQLGELGFGLIDQHGHAPWIVERLRTHAGCHASDPRP